MSGLVQAVTEFDSSRLTATFGACQNVMAWPVTLCSVFMPKLMVHFGSELPAPDSAVTRRAALRPSAAPRA